MQQAERGIHPVTLPPMGTATPEQNAIKSLTHWVWTPYQDISNMGPIEIKSQLGYRDQRWTEFMRCVPYPLGNLISYEPDREMAEAAFQSAMVVNSAKLPKVETVKYAQDQAAELGHSYRDVGLRVLVPLIGMDDFDLVNRIVQVVQPFAYAIHEMRYEFTEGAKSRIEKSNLSSDEKQKAYALAKIMFSGAVDPKESAEAKALAEYEILISSMSDKSVGQPGISNPTSFHEWICTQLGKPVPKRIDKTAQGGTDSGMVTAMLSQQREIDELKQMIAGRSARKPRTEEAEV